MLYLYGRPCCQCQADTLPLFVADCKKRGLNITVFQLIGGAPESGGTHARGGNSDVQQLPDWAIKLGSEKYGIQWSNRWTWQGFSMAHCHGTHTDCPHGNSAYRWQNTELKNGGDGLTGSRPDLFRKLRSLPMRSYKVIRKTQVAAANADGKAITIGGQKFKKRTAISAKAVDRARRFGWRSADVYWLQVGLRRAKMYSLALDGLYGPSTQAACDKLRQAQKPKWDKRKTVGVNFVGLVIRAGNLKMKAAK